MKIFLSPEIEGMIAAKVSSGRYRSADEVVSAGLKLLEEQENHTNDSSSNCGSAFPEAFEEIAKGVPESDWEKVPADLSKNVDHYLYGSHKSS